MALYNLSPTIKPKKHVIKHNHHNSVERKYILQFFENNTIFFMYFFSEVSVMKFDKKTKNTTAMDKLVAKKSTKKNKKKNCYDSDASEYFMRGDVMWYIGIIRGI